MSNLAPVPNAALDQARPSAPAQELHVVFRVAEAEYALPVEVVLQMESFTEATPIPSAVPFVRGIMPLRGRVVPVIDLRVRFGATARPTTLDSRVVVGQLGQRVVALLVDSAREVLKIAPEAMSPPPRIMSEGSDAFVLAVAQLGKRMILVLDFAKVIGEESVHAG